MKRLAYFLTAAILAVEIAAVSPMPSYAATTGVVNTAALNVRSGASTSYSRLGLLYEGASVTILGTSGSWYKVSCNIGGSMRTGYVHKNYINVSGQSQSGSSASQGNGKVNVSALNIRSSASTSSRVLGLVYRGTQVKILESAGDWYKVSVTISNTTVTGYAFAQYITPTSSGGSGSSSGDSSSGGSGGSSSDSGAASGSTGKVNTSALNVRTGASTSASRLGCIYRNQEVTILGKTGDWYKVSASVNGAVRTGYVSAQYITIVSSGNSGGSLGGGSSSGEGSVSGGRGVVNAGPLNVRSGPSTGYSIYGYVNQGTVVQIISTENGWYKVKVSLNGRTVTGYVSAQYITVSSDSGSGGDSSSGGSNSGSDNGNTSGGGGSSSVSGQTGVVNSGPLNVRTGPSLNKSVMGYLNKGASVKILATEGEWYQVSVTLNGRTVTGYVFAQYITVNASSGSGSGGDISSGGGSNSGSGSDNGSSGGGSSSQTPSDAAFEQQLAAFPESYKASLRALHEKYPNWVFKAINTGLDWNSAIAGENVLAVNVIQSSINGNTDFGKLSTMDGAYNWATDKYTMCDAGGYYTVSEGVLKYYMDPRNMLNEKYIFQFESQAYDSSQKRDVVQGILNGTFMSGNYTYTENGRSVTKNYTDTYMEAGKLSGVSPYFLAARSRQELGVKGSGSVSGNYGAYKGYYNYYNIGATSGADPISNGLNYAKGGSSGTNTSYGRPWTNPYKAIIGGADFLGASYIRIGQNTNYFQKFNVVYHQALYKHQYMTGIQAPTSESVTIYNSYKKMGVLDKAFVFYIPVYNNMPSTPCAMPSYSGNPNSYLKSLTVTGGGKNLLLTPTFNYKTTVYDLVVPANVSQVSISGFAVSAYAKGVSGTGTFSLKSGVNTFYVTCTAGNGTTTTYTINISRAQ